MGKIRVYLVVATKFLKKEKRKKMITIYWQKAITVKQLSIQKNKDLIMPNGT